jgi:hypothetical protein
MMSQYWLPQRVQRYKTPLLHHVRPKVAASQAEAGDSDNPITPAAIADIKKLFMTSSVVCSQNHTLQRIRFHQKVSDAFRPRPFQTAAASRDRRFSGRYHREIGAASGATHPVPVHFILPFGVGYVAPTLRSVSFPSPDGRVEDQEN